MEHTTKIQDFEFDEPPSPIRREVGWSEGESTLQQLPPAEGFDTAQGQSVSANICIIFFLLLNFVG